MSIESIIVGAVLALAALPFAVAVWHRGSRGLGVLFGGAWLGLSAAMAWAATNYRPAVVSARPVTDRPIEVLVDDYVSSNTCKACHPREYNTWYGSYHRTMTQVASPETLKAPWIEGMQLGAQEDRQYRLFTRDDEFWIDMIDPDWLGPVEQAPRVEKRLALITGSHHFQFFHFASGISRKMYIFPFCYRIEDGYGWMPLDGCCISPPTSRQESGSGRWNRVCTKCHTTHGRPRISGWDHMDSHVVEFGIACEACHGPGAAHVDTNRDPRRRYELHLSGGEDETIVNPADLPHDRSSHVCAQCHGVTVFNSPEERHAFREHGFQFRPGQNLTDSRRLARLDDADSETRFWADGMIRVSGREFMGLRRTPCYTMGDMSCLSCHVMHKPADDPRPLKKWANDQLKQGMYGDAACVQCHKEYEDPQIIAAHTHHEIGSTGSLCYNCHMPYTTYGLLKAIRSHEVSNPSVAETVDVGRPNACNLCHLDKSLEWTSQYLAEWYGQPEPALNEEHRTLACGVLWALKGEAGVRALTAWHMDWAPAKAVSGDEWTVPYLALMLTDPYHAVRYIAQRSLRDASELQGVTYEFHMPAEQRDAAMKTVYERWNHTKRAIRRSGAPHLLIQPDGTLDLTRFTRLLGERDNSRVVLNE